MNSLGRPVVAFVAVLVALLLGGCAGIPDDGPVFAGRRIEGVEQGLAQLIARDPVPGSSPTTLVRDFLRAAPDYRRDHQVARRFLVPTLTSWRAEAPVIVYADEPTLRLLPPGGAPRATPGARCPAVKPARAPAPKVGETLVVEVCAPVLARIDGVGRFASSPVGDREVRRFSVTGERVDGRVEWRIARLDDGLLVSSSDFGGVFREVPLYFPDRSGQWLVPDVRWFPVAGTTAAPALVVAALLQGATAWLQPAVTTGAPRGTTLTTFDPVRIDPATSTAVVDLSPEVRQADRWHRDVLRGQLRATLRALSSVLPTTTIADVKVTVQGADYDLQPGPVATNPGSEPGASGSPLLQVYDGSGLRPVVLDAKGGLARLEPGTGAVRPASGLEALARPGAQAPAVAPDDSAYAVLLDGRSRLVTAVPSGKAVQLLTGADLRAPSIDQWGWVWTTPAVSPGHASAGKPDPGGDGPKVLRVAAPWLRGARVLSLRLSGEGARAVVLAQRGARTELWVSAVRRSPTGDPLALTAPTALVPDLRTAADAVWADSERVVVLGARTGTATMPWVVQVGGGVTPTVDIADGRTVAAGSRGLLLYVQKADGTVVTRSGLGWTRLRGVQWPAMPG